MTTQFYGRTWSELKAEDKKFLRNQGIGLTMRVLRETLVEELDGDGAYAMELLKQDLEEGTLVQLDRTHYGWKERLDHFHLGYKDYNTGEQVRWAIPDEISLSLEDVVTGNFEQLNKEDL